MHPIEAVSESGLQKSGNLQLVRNNRLNFEPCEVLHVNNWSTLLDVNIQNEASAIIENGQVLVLPELSFALGPHEKSLLREDCVAANSKTVKYSSASDRLWGAQEKESPALREMLNRYCGCATELVSRLFPGYVSYLTIGNTSYRPVGVEGRKQSLRHDDRLLHVDAFPSRPSRGARLLRVFTNLNPEGRPRIWRVGERFEDVCAHFLPGLQRPLPFSAALLHLLGITKSRRTPYDHYMLGLHDAMKRDARYQADGPQATLALPAGSTWVMFSDSVPHAAMAGQFVLEQTFSIPPEAQAYPHTSPLMVLEKALGSKLI